MEAVIQMELFPSATKDEMKYVRQQLKDYPKMCRRISEIEQREFLNDIDRKILKKSKRKKEALETAIQCIMDEEIREIMYYRFIEQHDRWAAISKWTRFTDRSLDRKVQEGIKSIAETLKLTNDIE
ncbi:hypothetical protein [Paenibacillus sp. An7]|uniref:hypothetical protein n=1 Tax=Paenibacillus sp. An7 TaxID=2689577 RepID=UPI00135A5697|nr:hypothetical protein [Paenibacillus sp. An7]